MTLDFSRCKLPPFDHQKIDIQAVVDHPFFFNASEMGTGKTKIAIDAAQFLYTSETIDKVLIVCPNAVRSVWEDPELGEIRKHLWDGLPARVVQYHRRLREWTSGPPIGRSIFGPYPLQFLVTNYEFIRSGERLTQLLPFANEKTLLVLDESSAVKCHSAQQTKACLQLRRACGRVLLISGTPIANNPLDLFSQGNILSSRILECKYITHFKARYAISQPVITRGGKALLTPRGHIIQKITGWQHLDELQRRFAPYVTRRLKDQCLDLPPKLDPVTLTATLTNETWRAYKAMRDEMVVGLSSGDYSIAQQTVTKIVRLAQITSGFLGGIEDLCLDESSNGNGHGPATSEIGREKLDVLLSWLDARLEEDPNFKLLVGCRFRPEIERAAKELRARYPSLDVGQIRGGQTAQDRQDAIRLLDPRTAPAGPVVVLMTNAGSLGLNLTSASTFFRLSRDFSLFQSLQADDRVHRPGQTRAVSYYDVIAEGPLGQHTIDRTILTAVRDKREVADNTAAAWLAVLRDE